MLEGLGAKARFVAQAEPYWKAVQQMPLKVSGSGNREKLRKQFWPKEHAWLPEKARGWFRPPRTLPLLLALLGDKKLSHGKNPGSVYLALYARHMDGGIVEITNEDDLAYESGYMSQRARRTWQEHMRLLEELGFIKIKARGNQKYRYVLLVHPLYAVEQLRTKNLVDENWWSTYTTRRMEAKETSYIDAKKGSKVVPLIFPERRVSKARVSNK